MKKYVEKKQKADLVAEFKSDSDFFETICKFLKEHAEGQEKDSVSSIINTALDIAQGNLLPVHINLIIAAVLEACGFSDLASKILKGVLVAALIAGIGSIAAAALKK